MLERSSRSLSSHLIEKESVQLRHVPSVCPARCPLDAPKRVGLLKRTDSEDWTANHVFKMTTPGWLPVFPTSGAGWRILYFKTNYSNSLWGAEKEVVFLEELI